MAEKRDTADDNNATASPWLISIDTGGTFTDCWARDPAGIVRTAKVLSTSALRGRIESVAGTSVTVRSFGPLSADLLTGLSFRRLGHRARRTVEAYDPDSACLELDAALPQANPGDLFQLQSPEPAPILAVRLVTGTPLAKPLPRIQLRLATTIGTNALLERSAAPVALFVTKGFADVLRIGTQQRPGLFALAVIKPPPLTEIVIEVDGRLAADGGELRPLDLASLEEPIERLRAEGIASAAIALLHSYQNSDHERRLAAHLSARGFTSVSCSSELAPFIQLLPRAETTVANAYLTPPVARYLDAIEATVRDPIQVMTSAGGLIERRSFRPAHSLLSGPAGGVAGVASCGRSSGHARLLGFDMGGTSTDVSRFVADFEYRFCHQVGDATVFAPSLAIETVAAGGGSICSFDGNRLRVGPRSAGADPGPACYGAGGPLTLTDVDLLLGRLADKCDELPLDREAAERALDEVVAAVAGSTAVEVDRMALLEGLLELADTQMADAIRKVSLERGYDPGEHTLVAFGGAGGQHACAVAASLGVTTILLPPDASLLSARGVAEAQLERFAERQILRPLDHSNELDEILLSLEREAQSNLVDAGVDPTRVAIRRRVAEVRYQGQESSLTVEVGALRELGAAFESRHQLVFGYRPPNRAIELVSVRVVASTATADERPRLDEPPSRRVTPTHRTTTHRTTVRFGGRDHDVALYNRRELCPGDTLETPALVVEPATTSFVAPGWRAQVDAVDALVLKAAPDPIAATADSVRLAQTRLDLFTHRFESIAEEMGEMLRRTAASTNIKDRLDYSCALIAPSGELLVNAPHIPVHLGSLGVCVRSLLETMPLGPGDTVVTNHPAFGGSHLPDVTVITPVHGASGRFLGFVASRAHHAEIGGKRPGSMPPDARYLAEEGVVIPPTYLVRSDEPQWQEIEDLLRSAPYPSRAIADNLADLRAAVAANRHGLKALERLAADHGEDLVRQMMTDVTDRAERQMRAALARLEPGLRRASDILDDGSPIRVEIRLDKGAASVSFASSAPVSPTNLNTTAAVVRSAVMYVFRLLLDDDLPLNDGLMRAIELDVPHGLLNPPFPADAAHAPAIVGGNVETSQRIVDVLLKALGLAAASQGTMNNILIGDDHYGYYETIAGGAGAGRGFAGADAVHTHMTNTRITDVEILERRYPVRVRRFAIRRGSGGDGRYRGGDGVIREFELLAPSSLSVLTQRRSIGPYGMAGGLPGQPGRQWVIRADGSEEPLDAIDGRELNAGDRLIVETPGGGGYGTP